MNDVIRKLLLEHEELLVRLDATTEQLRGLTAALAELRAYLEHELEGHFAVEEESVFPALAGCPDVGAETIAHLVAEHGRVRTLLRALGDALDHGGGASRVTAAEAIVDLLRSHVAQEHAVLFAVAVSTPPV